MLAFALALVLAATPEARPELFAPGVISIPVRVSAPSFSPAGDMVIFEQGDGISRRLMSSQKTADGWAAPTEVKLGGEWFYIEPSVSPDGRSMIVASNRAPDGSTKPLDGAWGGKAWPGRGGALWRVERTDQGWSAPRPLSSRINLGSSTFEPALARSGALYFMRPAADGDFHIFQALPRGDDFDDAKPMPFYQAGISDFDPAVAPDESFVIFPSGRGGKGPLALYISFHQGAVWTTPQLLPAAINIGRSIIDPHLSPDAKTLYYTQDGAIWSVPLAPILEVIRPPSAST